MTTEARNTPERNALNDLSRYVARQILRMEGIAKSGMETLTDNFTDSFEWQAEHIFKANIKLEFFVEVNKLLCDEECNEEAVKFYLRHTAEHKTDDVMHTDPYGHSSNGASNLAHRWRYEANKDIIHLALNLLDRITPDAE